MKYRQFGKTDMQLSEISFGAWAIGGKSFGRVSKNDAISALAKAEDLGCNFVDTAAVYGESETILGEYLQGRRDKWYVATKYSGSERGMTATLQEQLKRLQTDYIDFYQIHWAPTKQDHHLYDELNTLKRSGVVRYVGVSLYDALNIDYVLDKTDIDGFMVAFSLLDPFPFLQRIKKIRKHNVGVIVRSCLHDGFLTGKYNASSTFNDENDQRSKWPEEKIKTTVERVEQFRFLEQETGSMVAAAAQYPLSFPEVTSVVMSAKNEDQASINFGEIPNCTLSQDSLVKIRDIQSRLGLQKISPQQRLKTLLSQLKQKYL